MNSSNEHCLDNEKTDDTDSSNFIYYYENIDRDQSEKLLRLRNRPGSFLIRKHQNKSTSLISSPYVLCLIGPNSKIYHYLIYEINQYFFIKPNSNEFYKTIKELVDAHRINAGVLPCILLEYVKESLSTIQLSFSFNIDNENLIRQEVIGQGHFGIVYKGLYNGAIPVALKMLYVSIDECETNILCEGETMMNLNHRYLVNFYGLTRLDNRLCLVTEFVADGCFLFWLQKQKIISSDLIDRLQLYSFQICDAMAYLEAKSIIHRDLAARNCLINQNQNIVKLGDFGMARFSSTSIIYQAKSDTPFPLRWSSPEVLLYREYSSKSDVWSYAILCWEIFSLGQLPFGQSTSNDDVVKFILSRQIPSKPTLAKKIFYKRILCRCWTFKANDRPNFCTVHKKLSKIFRNSLSE